MSRKLLIPLLLAGLLPLAGCCSKDKCEYDCPQSYSNGYSYGAANSDCPDSPYTEATPPGVGYGRGDVPPAPARGVNAPPVIPNIELAPAPVSSGE